MDEIVTQIYLLTDCIDKKIEALEKVFVFTNEQTHLILTASDDNKAFDALVLAKKGMIDGINDLDIVFESIFNKIKDFIGKGSLEQRKPMLLLQEKIVMVTELTQKIKTVEEKNARILTGGVRKPPKKLISSSQAVSAYKKNKKN